MKKSLLHVLIIWSEGLEKEDHIINDLSQNFIIKNIFNISWKQSLFHENLRRFYSHSQKSLSEIEFDNLIAYKIAHCGNGPFTAIILEDKKPDYKNIKTSDGVNSVNSNIFYKKKEYRNLLGGGHKIHASDNHFETNKDLSLLFGCTIQNFSETFKSSEQVISRTENILGVPEYRSIDELFFVLNNTMDYVVLRNFESLPHNYTINGHGDIDLLVREYNYVKYLTGAKSVFTEKYRVFNKISINGEEVPFDFRYVGDEYYDMKWQLEILENRLKTKYDFYIPDEENHFYSLLYHAYVQKRHIAEDYKITLTKLAIKIDVNYQLQTKREEVVVILNDYLESKGFDYTIPNDLTVYYNEEYAASSDISFESNFEGKLISSTISRTETSTFLTKVYKKDDVFIKTALNPICLNEFKYLNSLAPSVYFPECLNKDSKGNYTTVTLAEIKGSNDGRIVYPLIFWNRKNIISFINDCISILIELIDSNCMHRDIRIENFILVKDSRKIQPRLIDFGWAVAIESKDPITPLNLGLNFKWPGEGFSDSYSMGLYLENYFKDLHFCHQIITSLKSISPLEYREKEGLKKKLRTLKDKSLPNTTYKDKIVLFIRKYGVSKTVTKFIGKERIREIKKTLHKN